MGGNPRGDSPPGRSVSGAHPYQATTLRRPNPDHLPRSLGLRHRFTGLSQRIKMQPDPGANEPDDFPTTVTQGYAAWQVGYVRTVSRLALLDDNQVFHSRILRWASDLTA